MGENEWLAKQFEAERTHLREEPLGGGVPEPIMNQQDGIDLEHDLFAVPFDEIAGVEGRFPTAARQLASRARRRVRGAATVSSHEGHFDALLAVLDPEVVLRADSAAVHTGTAREVRGAQDVARQFSGSIPFAPT